MLNFYAVNNVVKIILLLAAT